MYSYDGELAGKVSSITIAINHVQCVIGAQLRAIAS